MKIFDAGQIALENLLFHQRGSSIQRVTSSQPTCFVALYEMTRNVNTIAGVVNDPVNPNNGGEILSVSKSSSFYFRPDIPALSPPSRSLPPLQVKGKKKRKQTPALLASSRGHSTIFKTSYPLHYIPPTSQPHSLPLHSLFSISDVAEVQVGLLYAPVWGDVFWLVTLHVLLHG